MARRAHRVQESLDVAGGEFSRVREEICAAPGGARHRRRLRREANRLVKDVASFRRARCRKFP